MRVRNISNPEIDYQEDGSYRYTFTVYTQDGPGYEFSVPSNVMERFHLASVLAFYRALSAGAGRENEELSLKLEEYKNISLDLGGLLSL